MLINTAKKNITQMPNIAQSSFKTMITKGKKRFDRHYNSSYENLKIRKKIIRIKLKKFTVKNKLKNKSFYLAIGIIDHISSKYYFDDETFISFAIVSLMMTAKLNESQRKLNSLNSLESIRKLSNRSEIEKTILKELSFNLNIFTPFDYVSEILQFIETYTGIKKKAMKQFIGLISSLTYIMALEYKANKYNALVVALSILMTGRKLMGCKTLLPKAFVRLTGYSEEILEICYETIYFFGKRLRIKNRNRKISQNVKPNSHHSDILLK